MDLVADAPEDSGASTHGVRLVVGMDCQEAAQSLTKVTPKGTVALYAPS